MHFSQNKFFPVSYNFKMLHAFKYLFKIRIMSKEQFVRFGMLGISQYFPGRVMNKFYFIYFVKSVFRCLCDNFISYFRMIYKKVFYVYILSYFTSGLGALPKPPKCMLLLLYADYVLPNSS